MRILRALTFVLFACYVAGCAHIVANVSGPGITDEAPGTRTLGMVVEDENIETKILANLYKSDARFKSCGLSVHSYNGVVVLAGTVTDQTMQIQAVEIARKMRQVRQVHDELVIAAPPSASRLAEDTWIKSKIRFLMSVTKGFPASRFEVIVVNGDVYLMGLVTAEEAAQCVDIIKDVRGIRKIVKIFEYIATATPATAS